MYLIFSGRQWSPASAWTAMATPGSWRPAPRAGSSAPHSDEAAGGSVGLAIHRCESQSSPAGGVARHNAFLQVIHTAAT